MLILLRRASASRCRAQVSSNVRHPKSQMQNCSALRICLLRRHFTKRQGSAREGTAFPRGVASSAIEPYELSARLSAASRCRFNLRCVSNCFASGKLMLHPVRWASRRRRQGAPRTANCGNWKDESQSVTGLSSSLVAASCGSIQTMVAALARFARLPNPSLNLTRNSAPRWPSEARYAHNAPLVQRVALPHAGYLKR
jgi:hypothetical protein